MKPEPDVSSLKNTEWLAQRLGLSVTTIERLRAAKSPDLPPHICLGHSIRYCETTVNAWIHRRLTSCPALQMNQEA